MTSKRKAFLAIILISVAALTFLLFSRSERSEKYRVVSPERKDIAIMLVTTGLVEPQNRLEIKPSISGRMEEVLLREGDMVKAGDVLARMSSTERAALIDAARLESQEVLEYWEGTYKKNPLIAPIDGKVIARNVEPGQTVATTDVVLVISDRLVVKAQFDETDIGRVRKGQKGTVLLDAYPEINLRGAVDHIAYESEIINNVTIYNVDIMLDEVPEILRSGMSVTVELPDKLSEDVITLPFSAVRYDGNKTFVLVREKASRRIEREVEIGMTDGDSVEIVSGLTMEDKVLMPEHPGQALQRTSGVNPFLPSRRR